MGELSVFNLYEKSNLKKQEEFMSKIDSTLEVQTEYEKVTEDMEWIEIMELTVPYIDNILRNPNRFIINEEEIVKIELARKITVESIKHLSRNTNLIQDIDKKTGDVKPSKILNINKEESYDTYENRFVYSLIQNMKFFISRKKRTVEERQRISEKNDKQFEYKGMSRIKNEDVNISLQLSTNVKAQEKKKENIMDRIEKLEQKIADLTCTEVYKILDKKHMTLVTSPIKKTNVILKNVNFQYAVKLWNYLQENYDDKSKIIKNKNNYMDNNELKSLVDDTFFLNYLIISTLDKDDLESEDERREAAKETINQMIERIVLLNSNLTKEELKDLVADRYAIIRHKNNATISEIQKIFKKHIDKYLENIK